MICTIITEIEEKYMDFREFISNNICLFDGAMGTSIQGLGLDDSDFGDFSGCNEWLVMSIPGKIIEIHESYLKAGANVVETNTFGANEITLSEFGLADLTYEINKRAAEIAVHAVDKYRMKRPVFVSGSIGPGSKLPSLLQVDFTTLKNAYIPQIRGLIDGGVDILQIETCQDLLQIKAAYNAAQIIFEETGTKIPIFVQVTMQENGRMLLGSDLSAVVRTLSNLDIDVIGLNCGTGPVQMRDYVRILSDISDKPVSVLPNAGLPVLRNDRLEYDITPELFAEYVSGYVRDFGINIVGGCCGTTQEHISLLHNKLKGLKHYVRLVKKSGYVSSMFSGQETKVEPAPFIIGEKCNTNGSKRFRRLLKEEKWDEIVSMALEQQNEGAHAIDLCTALTDRNEKDDMVQIVKMLNTDIQLPLMIDSTSYEVIENALQCYGGKPIINSATFENGDKPVKEYIRLCRLYSASLICLAIDEKGMADNAQDKIKIFERFHRLTQIEGLMESDMFFDCLTFTLGTGDKSYSNSANESLKAIKHIHDNYPEVNLIMGISNVSYGLKKNSRKVLNSVFLHECIAHGLNAAIVDAGKIIPVYELDKTDLDVCRDLIYNRKADALEQFISRFSDFSFRSEIVSEKLSVSDKVKDCIIKGKTSEIKVFLNELLNDMKPAVIVNEVLLSSMSEVGELFGRGELQLPFVLKSAEVMKKAVSYLENFFESDAVKKKSTILLATVQGDVHDIGKNLVEIILSNNGYNVIDLGVKQTSQQIADAVRNYSPDFIGLSALLIKSTYEIKNALIYLRDNGISVPVLCGGAALNDSFVRKELQLVYKGTVVYCKDALAGLNYLDNYKQEDKIKSETVKSDKVIESAKCNCPATRKWNDNIIPDPPYLGCSMPEVVNLDDLKIWLNKRFLYYTQWGLKASALAVDAEMRHFAESKIEELFRIGKEIVKPAYIKAYFECAAEGEQLLIYTKDPGLSSDVAIDTPFSGGKSCRSVGSYFRKTTDRRRDLCAFQVVTLGKKAVEYAAELKMQDKYQDYLLWHGFCAALTEALAAACHYEIRKELKIEKGFTPDPDRDFKNRYQGARYSFGYNCCPDMNNQRDVLKLLKAERIGLSMNKADQIIPEYSTCALISHNPQSMYW